jgi:hypothetical protein
MKRATYGKLTFDYDENAPCSICGEPVVEASMGGTNICPWCDCGNCRYCHKKFSLVELMSGIPNHVAKCKEEHAKKAKDNT